MVKQFEVYWVSLDPTRGREIKKTRPCVVISPNEMNKALSTVIIAPMTSSRRDYPTRVNVRVLKKDGQIVLDQIRTVDKQRLSDKLDTLGAKAVDKVKHILQKMFE